MRLINNEDVLFSSSFAASRIRRIRREVHLQQLARWKYDPLGAIAQSFCKTRSGIARQLVQSVDVWMNVPRRPLEASGTSGGEGGDERWAELSVLDGWWIEGYDGTNVLAIGDEIEGGEAGDVDEADAESLYRMLEQEVLPTYTSATRRASRGAGSG